MKNGVKLVKFLEVFRVEALKTVKVLIRQLMNNTIGKPEEEQTETTDPKKPNLTRKSTAMKQSIYSAERIQKKKL
jgi:hypothetical protein